HGHHLALRALRTDRFVYLEGGGIHGAVRPAAVQDDVHTHRGQLVAGEQGRSAEFGNVGQDGYANRLAYLAVHLEVGDGLGKDHVGAGFDVGAGAIDGGLQPFVGQRVGACHDDKTVVGTRVNCSFHAVDHFFLRDQFLARAVTATLGP